MGLIIEMGSFQFTVVGVNISAGLISLHCLNITNNEEKELNINLSSNGKKSFSFGRKNTNDFSCDDQHLSGIHAKIHTLNGNFVL